MSVRAERKTHMVLVTKDKLTTRSLSPSSSELFDLMHLTTCEIAIKKWNDNWLICPVCNSTVGHQMDSTYGLVSYTRHKPREDILV